MFQKKCPFGVFPSGDRVMMEALPTGGGSARKEGCKAGAGPETGGGPLGTALLPPLPPVNSGEGFKA